MSKISCPKHWKTCSCPANWISPGSDELKQWSNAKLLTCFRLKEIKNRIHYYYFHNNFKNTIPIYFFIESRIQHIAHWNVYVLPIDIKKQALWIDFPYVSYDDRRLHLKMHLMGLLLISSLDQNSTNTFCNIEPIIFL